MGKLPRQPTDGTEVGKSDLGPQWDHAVQSFAQIAWEDATTATGSEPVRPWPNKPLREFWN